LKGGGVLDSKALHELSRSNRNILEGPGIPGILAPGEQWVQPYGARNGPSKANNTIMEKLPVDVKFGNISLDNPYKSS